MCWHEHFGKLSVGKLVDKATGTDAKPSNVKKPNPVDVHVGSRVRLRRMLLGMSQEKLGDQLGLTFQQVQKYEKGINRIGASRLFQLSKILEVNVQFFFDEVAAEENAGTASGFAEGGGDGLVFELLNSREGLELNRAFAKISNPRVRRRVIELVRSISDEAE